MFTDICGGFAVAIYQPYIPEINLQIRYSLLVSVLTLIFDGCRRSGKEKKGSGACMQEPRITDTAWNSEETAPKHAYGSPTGFPKGPQIFSSHV